MGCFIFSATSRPPLRDSMISRWAAARPDSLHHGVWALSRVNPRGLPSPLTAAPWLLSTSANGAETSSCFSLPLQRRAQARSKAGPTGSISELARLHLPKHPHQPGLPDQLSARPTNPAARTSLVGARYFAERPEGGPDWGLRFVVTFLLPKG